MPNLSVMTTPEQYEADWDEIITCADCGHCFQLTDPQCKMVAGRMSPYGNWHRHEREVFNAMRHALKCFGICEVKGELVGMDSVPCGHFTEQ